MQSYEEIAQKRAQAIQQSGQCTLLAIETSCDETAAAVLKNGRAVLSSIVYSQIPVHEKYGGVVPELASRNHVAQLPATVRRAMGQAGYSFSEIDAIAVTAHPGLVGALLTGVNYAKGLAYALGLPLIGVDHITGHIAANYLSCPALAPPFLALVVSGSHSHLFEVLSYTQSVLLGRTRDDAAGEAFDKAARVLGLGYPGGPKLERLAQEGNPRAIALPIGIHGDTSLDFSFSGLKTAVINKLHTAKLREEAISPADMAASFQYSLIESLVEKSLLAISRHPAHTSFVLAGGVAANNALRERLRAAVCGAGLRFFAPEAQYTGDNAAMIGCAGYYALCAGQRDGLSLNAAARNIYE